MKGLLAKIEATWGIKKEFRAKVFLLSLAFFLLMITQAVWRPLKNAVFLTIVGVKYIPNAKFLLIFPLVFLIFLYSKLVDWLRRHHLFYSFTISFALVGFVIYYFLVHPVYGIANTTQSPSRIFGWVFYFYMESFGAFMSAVFWSFANSINKPKDGKRYYSLFVIGSKIGGILGAGSLYFVSAYSNLKASLVIPTSLVVGNVMLLLAAGSIYLLMKFVPGYLMHGYEAAYQYEKKRKVETESFIKSVKTGLEGIFAIFKNPYVFGIFSLTLTYEVIIVIIDYLVDILAVKNHPSAIGLVTFFSLYMVLMHSMGLLIAIFGTAPIQRFLGVRISLFACPLASLAILPLIYIFPNIHVLFFALVTLRALNYGLHHPTKETLFIPTTKVIKFKAKAWTDAFGSRVSKAGGSLLNKYVLLGLVRRSALFSILVAVIWVPIAYFLGKTYYDAVSKNKVIGAENNE